MRSYEITVDTMSVKVVEIEPRANRSPDYVALIDGERVQYFLKRAKGCETTRWREQAISNLMYHAKNAGNYVQFTAMKRRKKQKKLELSDKQLGLL